VVEPGPGRAQPRCPHYEQDECGGCQLQHLATEQQLAAKRGIVGDALRRIGRLDLDDPEVEPSDREWGYRTKLTLAVAAAGRRIGLHRYDRPGELFDLARCHITAPVLMDLWQEVSRHRALLPTAAKHLVLRLDRDGGCHLIVQVMGQRSWSEAQTLHDRLTAQRQVTTIWWTPEGGAPRVVAGAPTAYPATVFEQVHPGLGDLIRRFAVDQLGPLEGRHVWDLYAGIGETSDLLHARGASVESVEVDSRAVAAAERRQGVPPDRLHRLVGRVEHLVDRLHPPDLVITNPPRTGMDARVIDAIRTAAPRRLVYVSCDPATLARDVARMTAPTESPVVPASSALTAPPALSAYRLTAIRAFDLFPQTAHVESVALLESV
jgi:23S rRNA (uracil1939-C5)-methyltransferase